MTDDEFFHWLRPVFCLTVVLMFARISLLIRPISLFVGLMSLMGSATSSYGDLLYIHIFICISIRHCRWRRSLALLLSRWIADRAVWEKAQTRKENLTLPLSRLFKDRFS